MLDPGGYRPLEGPVPVGKAVGSEDLVEVDVRLDQRPHEDVPGEVELLARRRLLALRRGRVDDLLDAVVRDDEVHDTSPGQERAADEYGVTRAARRCARHHSPPHSCDLIAREAALGKPSPPTAELAGMWPSHAPFEEMRRFSRCASSVSSPAVRT